MKNPLYTPEEGEEMLVEVFRSVDSQGQLDILNTLLKVREQSKIRQAIDRQYKPANTNHDNIIVLKNWRS